MFHLLPLLSPWLIVQASLSLFCRYYFGRCSSEVARLVPFPFSWGKYTDRLHDFSVTNPRCWKDVYVNRFIPCTTWLWISLPIKWYSINVLLSFDLNGFNYRINRQLLTVDSLQRDFLCAWSFCNSLSCTSMLSSGCADLHGVNPNLKKSY